MADQVALINAPTEDDYWTVRWEVAKRCCLAYVPFAQGDPWLTMVCPINDEAPIDYLVHVAEQALAIYRQRGTICTHDLTREITHTDLDGGAEVVTECAICHKEMM